MYTLVMDCPSATYIRELRYSLQQQQQQRRRRRRQAAAAAVAAATAAVLAAAAACLVSAESANYFARSLVARDVVGLSDSEGGVSILFRGQTSGNERGPKREVGVGKEAFSQKRFVVVQRPIEDALFPFSEIVRTKLRVVARF